ncbi:MAG: tRNA (adenosine(37)-N6)-dimethylallyltransferase MiaA, partial [Pseudomonadota bacterium]
MNKLLVICGPTASGKTALAVHLAKLFNGEIISADSRQVYIGMDIGTGKDTSELSGVPIWMIDVVRPDEEFSVSHYTREANAVMADIRKRGKIPLVVGGTGLYIKSLTQGFGTIDIPPNKRLRKKLNTATVSELQGMLTPSVLDQMNQSDRNNPRRLIRKIEIALSDTTKSGPVVEEQDLLCIGLMVSMEVLYRKIDERVEKRVAAGVKDEIQTLLQQGYSWNMPSMNTLGYKEWKHASSDDDAITRWKFDEHAYARRQMTWIRKMHAVFWFDVEKNG